MAQYCSLERFQILLKDILKKEIKCILKVNFKLGSWQDQDGNNRYTTEVIADNLTMLGKSPENKTANTNPVTETINHKMISQVQRMVMTYHSEPLFN